MNTSKLVRSHSSRAVRSDSYGREEIAVKPIRGSEKSRLILITGGARSGKSRFAEQYAEKVGREREGQRVYLATAEALDEEMKQRVEQHRKQRAVDWKTIEEPYNVEQVAERLYHQQTTVLLLDCVTLWLSNLCLQIKETGAEAWQDRAFPQAVFQRTERFAALLQKAPFTTLLVTNEVGDSLVPEYPLGRVYRDTAGKVNQILADAADEVYWVVCGIPVNIRELSPSKGGDGIE